MFASRAVASLGVIAVGLLTAQPAHCQAANAEKQTTPLSKAELAALAGTSEAVGDQEALRLRKLRETAEGFAVRAGLEYRSHQIVRELEERATQLDEIFELSGLVIPLTGGLQLMPAVIDVAGSAIKIENTGLQGLFTGQTIRILEPSRLVTRVPSWRDFLLIAQNRGPEPDVALLPKGKAEQAVWKEGVERGWNIGIQQADILFSDALARLERTVIGMVTYRILLSQGMIQPAWIDQKEDGAIVDDDIAIIDQRTITVTAPTTITGSRKWTPVIR